MARQEPNFILPGEQTEKWTRQIQKKNLLRDVAKFWISKGWMYAFEYFVR